MTDQTTPTTEAPDHVIVTNTVVEQLAGYPSIRFHHGNGEYTDVPRYIADEIGQAVLALVPDEPADLTPAQYALLDAVKEVAVSSEAPAARYATEQLARLTGEAFGYPLPEPEVVRRGGFADIVFGRPVRVDQLATGGPISAPPRRPTGKGLGLVPPPSVVDEHTDEWPFKPGEVVRDSGEDADHGAWLDAAPVDVVVVDGSAFEWRRVRDGWIGHPDTAPHVVTPVSGHDLQREYGPLTVVSVPGLAV